MKAVILAGGFGTRLSEETDNKPKPMVEIGDFPILWHIMKIYSFYGVNDFIICLGYKGYIIKEYFANYHLHSSDVESSCTRAESLGPMYVRPRSRAFACGQAMVRQVLPGEAREEVQVGARPGNSIHLVVDAGRGARK